MYIGSQDCPQLLSATIAPQAVECGPLGGDAEDSGRGSIAGKNGGRFAVWPVMLSVDGVSKGFRRLEGRHLGGRDGHRLPGLGIAALTGGAAAYVELAESGDDDRLVPPQGICDGGEHGRDHALGAGPARGGLGGDVRDDLAPIHVAFPLNGDLMAPNGASAD